MEEGEHDPDEMCDALNGAGSDGMASLAKHNGRLMALPGQMPVNPHEEFKDRVDEAAATKDYTELLQFIQGLIDDAVSEAEARIIISALSIPRADSNPHLCIDCIFLASGSMPEGLNEVRVAKMHKVTRQAVSKRVINIKEGYDVVSRVMKSNAAREKYRDPKTKHWNIKRRFDSYGNKKNH